MDPINTISINKDSSFAMLLEAQARNYEIYYMEPCDLFIDNSIAKALVKKLEVTDNTENYYRFFDEQVIELSLCDVLLIRNDPPFDSYYLNLTHILELAEESGSLIVNKPASIRDYNEKLAVNWFVEYMPNSLVSSKPSLLKEFVIKHGKTVIKPLDGMGGNSIFILESDSLNLNVIIETITKNGTELVMIQEYIAEISEGDKRILMIDGEPINFSLARIPTNGEFRGNIAKGASVKGQLLTKSDKTICAKVGPVLKSKGLMFVGLDVIGNYLTEINVTSPTGIRELDKQFNLNIAGVLFDAIENNLN